MDKTGANARALFERALELVPAERAAWLAANCPDRTQREAIERMLATDAQADARVLDRSFDALLESIPESPADADAPPPGTRIGPFTLLDKLGEGGSSVVYRAEREQDGVCQRVALKLLRRGLYTAAEQRRFRDERRALAQLRHPGIAHLVEGGITDSGIPYIALELIEGTSITEHARSHQLDLRERLGLFVAACRAVDAAHRALIVHRDLKPSNVLVTPEGAVKLLDFGIAKLLDDEPDATRTDHRALTPGYAAPEQFSGGAITTATDVYALGVLLGELMTGQRRAPGDTHTPSSRIAVNTPAGVLPASADRTRRQLRGDLDNVVLKATAEEPERRYPSAAAFADDIERHLAQRPVHAHPPSKWYRARKFVARHRGGVATTCAFLLAVFAALGIALWQAGVAREQAQLARQQAQRAEAVRDLLVGLFDAEIPSRPRDEMPGTAELLERGANNAMHDLGATPAVQSNLLVALGRVYDHLALPDKGEPVLDAAIAAARRIEPPDPALLAEALGERGELELSRSHYPQALAFLQQAYDLQLAHVPDSLALALTLDRRAHARSQTGAHDAAIADYHRALAIRERLLPAGDAEILNDLNALGSAYNRAGRPRDALPLLRRAVDGARAAFGDQHVKTAHYIKNLAATFGALRDYAESARLTAQSVAIERTLYPKGSPDIVNGLNNLGAIDLTLGRLHAAREVLEEGRMVNRDAGLDVSMGQTFVLGNLARAESLLGERTQALQLLDSAERSAIALVGAEHARTRSLVVQRDALALEEDPGNAALVVTRMQDVLAHADELGQFRARSEIEAHCTLGLAQAILGHDTEADAALAAAAAALPVDHVDPLLLPAVAARAQWQHAHGQDAAAYALLTDWIARAARELAPSHYALGLLHLALAEMQSPADARPHLEAARSAFVELPNDHPWQRRLAALDVSR
ncbi:protein kinase domain-containing protein [Dokdonella sp.]|uniref:serine/threonine-protein kinase n=1 Tax=Dokdonella sp. TaxID=2291710 RepID=UPI0037844655